METTAHLQSAGAKQKAAETRELAKDPEKIIRTMQIAEPEIKRTALLKHIESVPERFRLRAAKAIEGTLSPTQAIRLKCAECCGFEDVDSRVKSCASWRCPLWKMR